MQAKRATLSGPWSVLKFKAFSPRRIGENISGMNSINFNVKSSNFRLNLYGNYNNNQIFLILTVYAMSSLYLMYCAKACNEWPGQSLPCRSRSLHFEGLNIFLGGLKNQPKFFPIFCIFIASQA